MRLSGKLDGGYGTIYAAFTHDVAGAASTTASTATLSVIPSSETYYDSHVHSHSELFLEPASHPVRLADVSHEAKLTPLDGAILGGALLCPVAGYKARRRFKL